MFDGPPYWHDSGDVLLHVNDEPLFRVHQCVLSVHSLVWKDMFQLGMQSRQLKSVDDLPVVPLNDPIEEICSLISAFYHGMCVSSLCEAIVVFLFNTKIRDDIREKHDLDAALGVLKLSHKYQADRIHKAVFNLLLESWPLNRVDYFSLPEGQRERVSSSIKLIRAARAVQCTALLPTAFYELATAPFEEWIGDGMCLLSDLASEDLSRLFIGKSWIVFRYKCFTSKLLEECASDPTLPKHRCCNSRLRIVRELIVEFVQSSKLKLEPDSVSCGTCREWLFPRLKELEIGIWMNIPEYFTLPLVEMGKNPFIRKPQTSCRHDRSLYAQTLGLVTSMFDKPPYWHTSGDVLLLVVDDGQEHKFRVHRYILSLHSAVWKDTFQLGTEVSAVDDLPVIPLDDPVKDVCSLLSAFYLGVEDIREMRDLDAALGILRLSHKYDADGLSTAIHNILQESWPLSRVDYFALPQERRQRVAGSIKLIKAASATQSTILLPVAFYELAVTPQEKWTEDAMNLLSELSSEDLTRLFIGKNRMIQRYKVFTAQLYAGYASDLASLDWRTICCQNRSRYIHEATIEFGQSFKLKSKTSSVPCGTCREWLFSRLKTLEIEIWPSIPAYFNIPSIEMAEDPFVRKVFS